MKQKYKKPTKLIS